VKNWDEFSVLKLFEYFMGLGFGGVFGRIFCILVLNVDSLKALLKWKIFNDSLETPVSKLKKI
jgi:hypothetical protein